jgi:hypothetical protein
MKIPLLVALAALASCLCQAATFAKPLTLTFYQKDQKLGAWTDTTPSDSKAPSDQGESSHKDDPTYLGHYKFTASDEPKRQFAWQQAGRVEIYVSLRLTHCVMDP